jgi:hypothetical protein
MKIDRVRAIAAGAALLSVTLVGAGVAIAGATQEIKPYGVPIPSYSHLVHVATKDHESSYEVSVHNEPSAYEFFITALPKAGFTVNKSESFSKQGKGQIWFYGGKSGLRPAGTLINIYTDRAVVNLEAG